jgi:hypothetical protein
VQGPNDSSGDKAKGPQNKMTINGTKMAQEDQISFPREFNGFHLPTLDRSRE